MQDVIDESDAISKYVAGIDFEGFTSNRMIRDAVERCLERVIEASVRLGPERIAKIAPGLPLHEVRSLGNVLRHAYDVIDPKLIWDTITEDVPALRDACARALAES